MKRLHKKKIDDAKYYEDIWAKENEKRHNHHFDAVRLRALLEPVKENDFVADVGAGVFGSAEYAVRVLKMKARFNAYDQSYTAKKIVDERTKGKLNYIVADCEKLPCDDEVFDVVMCGELIEHMEEPQKLVKELVRITKPGGYITLSTVDTECEQAKKHGDYPEHIWSFTKDDLINYFKPFGKVEFRLVGNYQFIKCKKYE